MPARPRLSSFAVAALALAACLVPGAAAAGILPEPEPDVAKLITTGRDSELIESVPIKTAPGLREKVVMSLSPEELPRLEANDTLRVNGEVQVSTTCIAEGPRCVGSRYGYNPRVYARVVLSPEPGMVAPESEYALSATEAIKCNQKRPNRNHHCTIAFPTLATSISDPAALPCVANACYANVVLGAWNAQAKPGNVVVLGADRPDGSVAQDKGRLNVVHTRATTPAPTEAASNFLINPDLPLTEGKLVKRRVVFTVELPPAKKGEVLQIDASSVAEIGHLPFNVFLSSRLIVAETPTATDPAGFAKTSASLRGDASEANGFNCTQGPSGYATPCTVEKAGAIRITEDVVDAAGNPAPLYINLVSSAKALLTDKVKQSQRVRLTSLGGLRVVRFQA